MDNSEQALIGWKAIAHMFNCSVRKMQSLREECLLWGYLLHETGKATTEACMRLSISFTELADIEKFKGRDDLAAIVCG